MRELANKIEEFARRKKQRRILAGASTLLALAVIAIVMMSLTKPAISLSEDGIFEGFNKEDAVNLSRNIGNIQVLESNPKDDSEGDVVTAKVKFEYQLQDGTVTLDNSKYVYLDLNDATNATKITANITSGYVTDSAYTKYLNEIGEDNTDDDVASGDYYIDQDTGTVIIKFRDKYLTWLGERGTGVTEGTFTLNADFKRGDDKGSTEYTFNIGNATVNISGYTAKVLGIQKSVVDNDDGTATWKIEINNPINTLDSDYYIVDDMLKNISEGSTIMVKDANDYEHPIEAHNKNTIWMSDLLGDSTSYSNFYIIEYTTPFEHSNSTDDYNSLYNGYYTSEQNTATLTNNTNQYTATTTVSHTTKVTLSKSTNEQNDYDYNNNTIMWHVTLTNEDGIDLNGMQLVDKAFKNIESLENVTIDGISDVSSLISLDAESGTLSFIDTIEDKSIILNYTVPATNGENGNNDIELKDKDGHQLSKASTYYYYNVLSIYDKKGTVNKTAGQISWQVTVETKQDSLDGFVFTDSMLKTLGYSADEINITDSNNWSNEISLSGSNGTYIITGDNTKKALITYTTPVYQDEANTNGGELQTDGETVVYKNTATIGKGDLVATTESTVTDTTINDVYKTLDKTEYSDDYDKYTAYWSIELKQNPGSYKGKPVVDTIELPNAGFSVDDIEIIAVTGSDENNNAIQLTKGLDYSFEYENNTNYFNLIFNETDVLSTLYNCTISYKTVFKVDKTNVSAATNYVINNIVEFNEKTDEETTTYRRPDLSNPPLTKTAYDISNSKYSTSLVLTKDNISSYQEDKYYVFNYTITIKSSADLYKEGDFYIFTDTLPKGFELDTDTAVSSKVNNYVYSLNNTDVWGNHYVISDGEDGNKIIKFYFKSNSIEYITYSAKVLCTEIDNVITDDGTYIANNTVKHWKYDDVTQAITVKPSTSTDEGVISKFGQQGNQGSYKYTIDVNTEGKQLVADGDSLTLIDTMVCNESSTDQSHESTTAGTNLEFRPLLNRLKIYKINDDGSTGDEIKEWKYTLATNTKTTVVPDGVATDHIITEVEESGTYSTYYKYYFEGLANHTYNITAYCNTENLQFGRIYDNNSQLATSMSYNWPVVTNGKATYSVTVNSTGTCYVGYEYDSSWGWAVSPDDVRYIVIEDSTRGEKWGSTYTEVTSLATLTITGLPDKQPLRIEYTYGATQYGNNEIPDYATANVTNSATLNGTGKTSQNKGWFVYSQDASSTSTGSQYLSLAKVDVGDFQLSLSAGFNLYKYDEVSQDWLPAISITKSSDTVQYYEVEFSDNSKADPYLVEKLAGDVVNLKLDSGVMYKIVETKEPDDYSSVEKYFGKDDGYTNEFYFCFLNAPTNIPSVAEEAGYKVVSAFESYEVQNVKKIDITITKNWVGLDVNEASNAKAEFELYRTTDLNLTNATAIERVDLSGLEQFKDATDDSVDFTEDTKGRLVLSGNGSSKIINNLPNGEDNNGLPYYYFVREVRYTLDGEEWIEIDSNSLYQPIYSKNCTGEDDSTITVTNTKDLIIKKIWQDSNGKTIEDVSGKPAITVELYRVIDNGSELSDTDIYTINNKVDSYTLDYSNNYEINVSVSEEDDSSVSYKYYVREVKIGNSNVEDTAYTVSYYNNGCDKNGIITITNKSTTTETASYVLPSTGSTGTRKLLIAGIALVGFGLAAVGIKLKRRNYEN
jgi:LPXTG-motif cell wall-anchored protein